MDQNCLLLRNMQPHDWHTKANHHYILARASSMHCISPICILKPGLSRVMRLLNQNNEGIPLFSACYQMIQSLQESLKGKGRAIPVTGREGPQGCEMPRPLHFLQTIASQIALRLSVSHAGRF
jgi:hypothetical protein